MSKITKHRKLPKRRILQNVQNITERTQNTDMDTDYVHVHVRVTVHVCLYVHVNLNLINMNIKTDMDWLFLGLVVLGLVVSRIGRSRNSRF
jgi:hypothetical protein